MAWPGHMPPQEAQLHLEAVVCVLGGGGGGAGWEETNHQGKPELRGQASGLRVAVQHPCYTQQPRGLL